jgi:serine/threonine protein kinase
MRPQLRMHGDRPRSWLHVAILAPAVVTQGAPIAVKLLRSPKATRRAITREAGLLRRLRHPCICTFFGVLELSSQPSQPAILLEYLAGGTLEDFLHFPSGSAGKPTPAASSNPQI